MELHEHKCCDRQMVYKGTWTRDEDALLTAYMEAHGDNSQPWKDIAKDAGLLRCGKSCRFRWLHYLSPSLNRQSFTEHEVKLICNLQGTIGNKWTEIAKFLPGRSDNSIKNFWNTYCKGVQHQQQIPATFESSSTNNQEVVQDVRNPSSNFDLTLLPANELISSSIHQPTINKSWDLNSSSGLGNPFGEDF